MKLVCAYLVLLSVEEFFMDNTANYFNWESNYTEIQAELSTNILYIKINNFVLILLISRSY